MQRDEALPLLADIVGTALDVDTDDIVPEKRLFEDLGADSLDFVDILFEVEAKFEVKLADSELDFLTRLDATDPALVQDGFLTTAALDRLRPVLPALDEAPHPARIKPRELYQFVTMETLWRVVDGALRRKAEKPHA